MMMVMMMVVMMMEEKGMKAVPVLSTYFKNQAPYLILSFIFMLNNPMKQEMEFTHLTDEKDEARGVR